MLRPFKDNTLATRIPPALVKRLTPVIEAAKSQTPLSIGDLIDAIQNDPNSPYLKLIIDYFQAMFGETGQTELVENVLFIGQGLQLTHNPQARALFYALDPNLDIHDIFSQPGYPKPALTSDQIQLLVKLSLLGVDNKEGWFPGYLNQLQIELGALSDTAMPLHQLLGMTSIIYSTNKPLPATTVTALQYMLDNQRSGDLAPMMCFVDYAHRNTSLSANLCLTSSAMFHGNATDVRTTHRAAGRLIENSNRQIITDSEVEWGIPISEAGFLNMTIPSFNPDPTINDAVLFGTPQNDSLTFRDHSNAHGSSPVVITFGGDDVVTSQASTNDTTPQFPFYSGLGDLTIRSESLTPHAEFSAPQYMALNASSGVLNQSYPYVGLDYMMFGGVMTMNPYTNQTSMSVLGPDAQNGFYIEPSVLSYNASTSGTALQLTSVWGNITVSDYRPGKFGIMPGNATWLPEKFSNFAITPQGGLYLLSNAYAGSIWYFESYRDLTNPHVIKLEGLETFDNPYLNIQSAVTANGTLHVSIPGKYIPNYYFNVTDPRVSAVRVHPFGDGFEQAPCEVQDVIALSTQQAAIRCSDSVMTGSVTVYISGNNSLSFPPQTSYGAFPGGIWFYPYENDELGVVNVDGQLIHHFPAPYPITDAYGATMTADGAVLSISNSLLRVDTRGQWSEPFNLTAMQDMFSGAQSLGRFDFVPLDSGAVFATQALPDAPGSLSFTLDANNALMSGPFSLPSFLYYDPELTFRLTNNTVGVWGFNNDGPLTGLVEMPFGPFNSSLQMPVASQGMPVSSSLISMALPISMFTNILLSQRYSLMHGFIRGSANAVDDVLTETDTSPLLSHLIVGVFYYTTFFGMQYCIHQQAAQEANADSEVNAWSSLLYAAIDTGILIVFDVALKFLSSQLMSASESYAREGWQKTSSALSLAAKAAQYGIYACTSRAPSLAGTVAAGVSGAAVEATMGYACRRLMP